MFINIINRLRLFHKEGDRVYMQHPLDKEFNIESEYGDEDFSPINIPDDPTLDTIIELSLSAYKEQMEVIGLVEPKNRIKYLEVAERFLNQAKDAMAKKENIILQRDKFYKTNSKGKNLLEGKVVEDDEKKFDRNSLYDLKEV